MTRFLTFGLFFLFSLCGMSLSCAGPIFSDTGPNAEAYGADWISHLSCRTTMVGENHYRLA